MNERKDNFWMVGLVLIAMAIAIIWFWDSDTINQMQKQPGVFIKDRGSLYIPIG